MHLSPKFKPALVYKGDRFTNHFRSYNPRDGYIMHNHGGFTIANEVEVQPKSGITYTAKHPRVFNCNGISKAGREYTKNGHIAIYRQDGTGRDTYILNNNGGFAIWEGSNKFGPAENFQRSLRIYQPIKRRRSFAPTLVISDDPLSPRGVPSPTHAMSPNVANLTTTDNTGDDKLRLEGGSPPKMYYKSTVALNGKLESQATQSRIREFLK